MSEALRFRKYEGLGNDFIVVDAEDGRDVARAQSHVESLCDRHFGVGADGILLVLAPRTSGSDAAMRVINADGSVPEMCGNGVRCLALDIVRTRGLRDGTVRIDTDAGLRTCHVEEGDRGVQITVDMGVVRVCGERTITLDGHSIALTVADAGNPHAVLFGPFSRADVERLGPQLATHASFPGGTNVEFARAGNDGVDLVVWERGVGITLACGTGACATAAVACVKGLAPTGVPLAVRLPGGRLDVTIGPDGRAIMRGPARHVFSGVATL